jgi:hypothetical protein
MLQSLTIGRAIGTGAPPTADVFLDGDATKSEDYQGDAGGMEFEL